MQQFKVGDWVVEIHSKEIHQIIELFPDVCRVRKPVSGITYSTEYTDFIPWKPKEGEWCWFFNSRESKIYSIGGVHLHQFGLKDKTGVRTIEGFCYETCEPFIGELPSFLKDIKLFT